VIYHEEKLSLVDPRLISVVEAIGFNVDVIYGARGKEEQERAFVEGRSKVQWPYSKHNVGEGIREFSEAIDLAPHPVQWNRPLRFYVLAGAMIQEAHRQGVSLRWGGDWDSDLVFDDQRFNDLGHFELVPEKPATEVT
jgi:peptidoglycan L-alanyl-D-glutamate endopeptidase CwlK